MKLFIFATICYSKYFLTRVTGICSFFRVRDIATFCSSKHLLLKLAWAGPCALTAKNLLGVPALLPGVYLLQHASADLRLFPAFYVGQSRDLRRRLAEHQKSGASGVGFFRRLRPTYFSLAHVAPACLDDVERSLIRLLAPPANDRTPAPETLILPTLPPVRLFHQP